MEELRDKLRDSPFPLDKEDPGFSYAWLIIYIRIKDLENNLFLWIRMKIELE